MNKVNTDKLDDWTFQVMEVFDKHATKYALDGTWLPLRDDLKNKLFNILMENSNDTN